MARIVSKRKTNKKALIHSTALVSPEAWLDEGVEVGPYSIVGPQVKIGRETVLSSHVHIEGDTEIGARCRIFPGAVIGTSAQAHLPKAVRSSVSIGDDNVIREWVTIHASMKEGGRTVVGSRNMFMASAHIAHDCVLGNGITMANLATLGGHVAVEDGVVIGGLSGVHQFVRIGHLAIVGGLSKVVMDVAPFSMADGRPAQFRGLNAIGLRRAGYNSPRRLRIRRALKELFGGHTSLTLSIPQVRRDFKNDPDVQAILSFLEKSKRGVTRASSSGLQDEEE